MPEPDFATLRAEAIGAARLPAFEQIQRRTRVRRRRMVSWTAATALIGGAVASAVLVSALARPPSNAVAEPPLSEVGIGDFRRMDPASGSMGIHLADAGHWYATLGCEVPVPVGQCSTPLAVSTDQARTWSRVAALPPEADRGRFLVLGPRAFGAIPIARPPEGERPDPGGPSVPKELMVSVDGGATWRRTGIDQTPMDAVPADGRVLPCAEVTGGDRCSVLATDPRTGRIAPLSTQPPVRKGVLKTDLPIEVGIWVYGRDPKSDQAVVAVSHDRGRTWSSHTFAEVVFKGLGLMLATHDGRTAYVLAPEGGQHGKRGIAHRTDDGGKSWQRVGVVDAGVPNTFMSVGESLVLPDGALVVPLAATSIGTDAPWFVVSRDKGATFQPVPLGIGPPADLSYIVRVPNWGYFTIAGSDAQAGQLRVSTDGWTWQVRTKPKR